MGDLNTFCKVNISLCTYTYNFTCVKVFKCLLHSKLGEVASAAGDNSATDISLESAD